jgi:hypothetical protein
MSAATFSLDMGPVNLLTEHRREMYFGLSLHVHIEYPRSVLQEEIIQLL